jgi:WhiB family redox-sensing transcriptional regulator
VNGGDWRDQGACRGEDPDLFFGPEDERPAAKAAREARAIAICARCLVRLDCLGFALGRPQKAGVWGGMSEDARARERRRRLRRAASAARRA